MLTAKTSRIEQNSYIYIYASTNVTPLEKIASIQKLISFLVPIQISPQTTKQLSHASTNVTPFEKQKKQ